MLWGRVHVRSNPRDRSLACFDLRHSKVGDLYGLGICGQEQVLRLDVTMNDSALMRISETRADLFEIEEGPVERKRFLTTTRSELATREVFQDDVVEGCSGEI